MHNDTGNNGLNCTLRRQDLVQGGTKTKKNDPNVTHKTIL